ncbi:MAG: hypothetical protein H6839_06265 [Planctomycetes bacterium]|nr:hypothetical protein [Planctomycetota bacterium]
MLTEASLDRIEAAVADAEKQTSCEYIVVLAPASSRYEGRIIKAGALGALLAYALLYSINYWLYGEPDALWLLLEAIASGALVAVAFNKFSPLRRLLIPRWVMTAAVDTAAHATFSQENASLTKDRNAVLIYVSVFEGEVRLMPDIGVQQKVHEGKLGEIEGKLANAQSGDPTELVCDAIRQLGACCGACFPIEPEDVNELPDRPQIRLP